MPHNVTRKQVWDWIREQNRRVRRREIEKQFSLSRPQVHYLFELMAAERSMVVYGDRKAGMWAATDNEPGEATPMLARNKNRYVRVEERKPPAPRAPVERPSPWRPTKAELASRLLAGCLGYPSTERVPIIEPEPELEAA